MLVREITEYLEKRFPKELAEDFDQPKIGLCIGSDDIEIKNIILALDLNMQVLKEAVKNNCNLIITHHSFIFNPIYKLLLSDEKTKIIKILLEKNISVFSMHTNLDVGYNGVNDCLAKMLDLKDIKIINNEVSKSNYLRYGKVNESLLTLIERIKKTFGLSGVRFSGDLNKKINTVGVFGGGGGYLAEIYNAISCGCDCLITGEIKLNVVQDALVNNLCLIEVKHGIEKFVFNYLKQELLENLNFSNEILISKVETDPFEYI